MNELQIQRLLQVVEEAIEDAWTIGLLLTNGITKDEIKAGLREIDGFNLGRIES